MTGFCRLCRQRRRLAAWLIAATLAVRVLVPAGYMPAAQGGLALMICPGHMTPAANAAPMPGMSHHGSADHDGDKGGDKGGDKAERPCAFAGLAMPSLTGGEPLLPARPAVLATALDGELADARAPPHRAFLRPFLRGPPSIG